MSTHTSIQDGEPSPGKRPRHPPTFPLIEPPAQRRWITKFLRSSRGEPMNLYSAFHSDSALPTFVEPRSFPDVRRLYAEIKSYPFLALYHCAVSRVEYCRTKDAVARDFVVAHINYASAAKPVGYLMVAQPLPLDSANGTTEKTVSDQDGLNSVVGDSVFIFNHYRTIHNVLHGSNFHVLFHARLNPSTCPLIYFIAAGQALAEHHPNCRVVMANDVSYWTGTVLFRLVCDTEQISRHSCAKDERDLMFIEGPLLDQCVQDVYLHFSAEVTNIRNMVQEARARKVEALAADVAAVRTTVKTVEAAANTADTAKQAAGIAIRIAQKEKEMRKAAEKRERQTKQAAEMRERELLERISELEKQLQ